ncbi:hypothetical protein [Hymenobacter sp. B81]|uniref:hypothetical protein n=1 Tax=Hymenobacter sp. B81 TaxID=3344878 RepID=UPI0037DCEB02
MAKHSEIPKSFGMRLKQESGLLNKWRKILSIVFFLLLSNSNSFAQSQDSIYYFVPAFVKEYIIKYVKAGNVKHKLPAYCIISHRDDTTSILVSYYKDSRNDLSTLIKNSNRFIKISSTQSIPVLMRLDFIFSNLLHSVVNEGGLYAAYNHKEINASGYHIQYRGLYDKAVFISAEYYQY